MSKINDPPRTDFHTNNGYIHLVRVGHRRWQAEEWSAFYVRLILSQADCRYFLDGNRPATAFKRWEEHLVVSV